MARYAPVVLYRTLARRLPARMDAAAAVWGICQMFVRRNPVAARRAGFGGSALRAGNDLFEAIVASPSGVVFAVSEYAESWQAVRHPDHRINLHIAELMPELASARCRWATEADVEYPFVLSAGERRSDTSNTSIRDPGVASQGSLRHASNQSAGRDSPRLHDRRLGSRFRPAVAARKAPVEISNDLQPGHVSLPNGHGIDYHRADGALVRCGVALNELTSVDDRDPIAGTPWHKHVAARVERVDAAAEIVVETDDARRP